MTRMWLNVDPSEMCPEHIKREIREIRQLVDVARGEWDVPTWAGDGSTALVKLRAHATDGHIDTRRIRDRWRRLWAEIDRRGLELDADREPPSWPDHLPHVYGGVPGPSENRINLASKCPEKCGGRMG